MPHELHKRGLRVFVMKHDRKIVHDYNGLPRRAKLDDAYDISTPAANNRSSKPGGLLVPPSDSVVTPKPSGIVRKRKAIHSESESEAQILLSSPGTPSPVRKKLAVSTPTPSPPVRPISKPNQASDDLSDYIPTPKPKPAVAPSRKPSAATTDVPRATRRTTRQQKQAEGKKVVEQRKKVEVLLPTVLEARSADPRPKGKTSEANKRATGGSKERPKTPGGRPAPRPLRRNDAPKLTSQGVLLKGPSTQKKLLPSNKSEVIELSSSPPLPDKITDGYVPARAPAAPPSAAPSAAPSPARSPTPAFSRKATHTAHSLSLPHNGDQFSFSAHRTPASPDVDSAAPVPGPSNHSQAAPIAFAPPVYEGVSHVSRADSAAPVPGPSNHSQGAPFALAPPTAYEGVPHALQAVPSRILGPAHAAASPVLGSHFQPGLYSQEPSSVNQQMQAIMQDPSMARQAALMMQLMQMNPFGFNNQAFAHQPVAPNAQVFSGNPMLGNANIYQQGPPQGDPRMGDQATFTHHQNIAYPLFGAHPNSGRGPSGGQ